VKILTWLRKITPLRIALVIAVAFIGVHIVIESDAHEFGWLSKKGPIALLDLKVLDYKFQSRDRSKLTLPDPKVVIAAVDERGVEKYGLWPWNRRVIAQFIDAAAKGGAKVIAFDAVFSDEDKNSSYVSIKKFLDTFEQSKLNPKSSDLLRIKEQIKVARSNALPAQRIELEIIGNQIDAVVQSAQNYHESLAQEISAQSPDEALAQSIARNPQTILGYFNFYNENEIVGLSKEEIGRDFKAIEKSGIDTVYDAAEQETGGNIIKILRPADIDLSKLEIRSIVAPQAPLQKFSDVANAFAFFNVPPDGDGMMRRMRLLNLYGNKLYPALSLLSAAHYFDTPIQPINGVIKPGKTLDSIAPLDPQSNVDIPIDMHGRLFINYYKRPEKYFPTYSVADFIDGSVASEKFKDKIVLFGVTAVGLNNDLVPTPFGPGTPGVYVHASVIQNIIDSNYLQRWFGIALIEALGYLLLAVAMGLIIPRLPAWAGLLLTIGFAVCLYLIDITFIFPRGYWILNMLPTIQAMLSFVGISVYGYFTEGREKRKIRKAFQYYLSRSVVDEVLKDTGKLKLGGERRICTVFFSDIRGFTTISEKLTPEELSNLLNEYLTPMTDLVFKYDGTLDKYMGDAIMAFFGAPIAYPDHATRACYCALDMMEKLAELQHAWRARNIPELDIGIGLNTGPMSVGNMGSDIRFDYTVMGDNVNLGSRLEGTNKPYGTHIIISQYTYEAAKQDIHARELDSVRVKGKKEPVLIYELLGKGPASADKQVLISTFSDAIMLYKQQKWDAAMGLFTKVKNELKPEDYASKVYIERCEKMREHAPQADWDGVYTMTTK
jgi:adenylate cyclase